MQTVTTRHPLGTVVRVSHLPIPVVGIAHVGVRVHSLERSRRFYELLGFEFVVGPIGPEPVAIVKHPSGVEINFVLNARESHAPNILMDVPEKHAGITHVALAVGDLTETMRALEAAGIVLSGGPIDFPTGHRAVFIRDPDGNVIELNSASK